MSANTSPTAPAQAGIADAQRWLFIVDNIADAISPKPLATVQLMGHANRLKDATSALREILGAGQSNPNEQQIHSVQCQLSDIEAQARVLRIAAESENLDQDDAATIARLIERFALCANNELHQLSQNVAEVGRG